MAADSDDRLAWWQAGTFYQVYPRSFQDSNSDGVGDLRGIRDRLDHFVWLGIDAVWISPVFPSPMVDHGYDVSDYCEIDPAYGTLEEFDRLVEDVHARGLKLVLDFVPNHTSDQHPWFLESSSSRDNPKRDWYIWRDPSPGGGPPNNWISNFGGSAWEWHEPTGQYYYHVFLKEQPDLNWENPAVREAMYDVLRFWMRRGVDGFRVDAMKYLVEDGHLRDNPPNPDWREGMPPTERLKRHFSADRPQNQEPLAEMRQVADEFPDRVLIGEAYLPVLRVVTYYGKEEPMLHLPFNFELISSPWNARSIEAAIDHYYNALPSDAWPNWVLGNHDRSRVASRVGPAQAHVAAMLQLTLLGSPFIYCGDEIGMQDVAIPPNQVRDPFELRVPGFGLGRDPQRTPMPWDDTGEAGFSSAEAWLPNSRYNRERNVERQRRDERSILHLYRALTAIRRKEPALVSGRYEPVRSHGDILAYERRSSGDRILVVLNFGGDGAEVSLPEPGSILLSTHLDRTEERVQEKVVLRGDEGIIIRIARA